MSQFYGVVSGQAKTEATRRGSAKSGLHTIAASWNGAIHVRLWTDDDGAEHFAVTREPWHGSGTTAELAAGKLTT